MTLEMLIPFVPVVFGIFTFSITLVVIGLMHWPMPGISHIALLLFGGAGLFVGGMNIVAFVTAFGLAAAVGYSVLAGVAGIVIPVSIWLIQAAKEEAHIAALPGY